MPWLNHPKFVRVRDEILEAVKRNEYRFRRTPNVLFLCGGNKSKPRYRLAEYIRTRREDTLVFYAEEVWTTISRIEKLSALEMEAELAGLSDIVVIIVESPGTFAELGAFSLSDPLRKKLLPILDMKYRTGESFLETGPVRWTDKDSSFRPCIWANHQSILEAAGDLEIRLKNILRGPTRIIDLAGSPKHLLFFICDLVAVFGPCPLTHVKFYLEKLLGRESESIDMLVSLASAMGLLNSIRPAPTTELYFRPLQNGNLPVFHYTKKHLGIPTLRAKVLGVMQMIPEAADALGKMAVKLCC